MDYNPLTQKVIYLEPHIDNTRLAVVDLTPEEIERDKQIAMMKLRGERNQRLLACDYTQLPDFKGDSAAFAAYRQALRDLPANVADARESINWPAKP